VVVSIHAPRAGGDSRAGNLLHNNNMQTIVREPTLDGKGIWQRASITSG
jgi:hypothetical protein